MSSTEDDRPRRAANALFDEAVAPLGEARRAAGQQAYFPLAPDPKVKSYFQEPIRRVMAPEDFEFPGGGTADGLVKALGAKWRADGDEGLAAMEPRLAEIAEALKEEADAGDGTVSVLCYTMF